MGCGGSRTGNSEITENQEVDLEGLTGEALQKAMRTHNVKSKWKSHKAPIDMDLLKELGLADDDDDAGDSKPENEKPVSAVTAGSGKSKKGEGSSE